MHDGEHGPIEPEQSGKLTRRKMVGAAGAAGLGLLAAGTLSPGAAASGAMRKGSEAGGAYYWISHGTAGDQIWANALKGAKQAGRDLRVKVNSSFHGGDVASQQEAIASAIAAKASGIATSSPQPKVLAKLVAKAKQRGIPVVTFNSDDPTTQRVAYVGADLTSAGVQWATYLVSHKLVKKGDLVWLPVEIAGASYQVDETKGIASVFNPRGIKYDVFETGYQDPAKALSNMTDYVVANGSKLKAMIGLGDLVTSNTPKVFSAAGWKAGRIPVVGWGNQLPTAQAVQQGYVKAALWQYPDSQGYMPIVILKMLASGLGAGYNLNTLAFYDKGTVGKYIKYLR